jgi:hypothetical protein
MTLIELDLEFECVLLGSVCVFKILENILTCVLNKIGFHTPKGRDDGFLSTLLFHSL